LRDALDEDEADHKVLVLGSASMMASSSAGHAANMKPAMLAIDCAATAAASHRRQSNGGSAQ
jgi:hypothetical protein